MSREAVEPERVAQIAAGALDAVQRYVAATVALARVELKSQARRAMFGAMALVPAIVGWALVCAAAVLAIGGGAGPVRALLLVGALNLVAAMLLFVRGARRGSGPGEPVRAGRRDAA